jgi:chromate reductase, NAD(P)H dehydrogenase (quinone)
MVRACLAASRGVWVTLDRYNRRVGRIPSITGDPHLTTHAPHSRPINIIAVAGSLRAGSFNRALMRAAVETRPPDMSVKEFDIRGVPFYDGDVEAQGDPQAVTVMKSAISAADGILIATPEYHHSIPGVLKNALDWAGRDTKGRGAVTCCLAGKPVGIIGAGGGAGTARAQLHLRQVLAETRSLVMVQPTVLVPMARQKFDSQLKLTDDAVKQQLADFMKALADWTRRLTAK